MKLTILRAAPLALLALPAAVLAGPSSSTGVPGLDLPVIRVQSEGSEASPVPEAFAACVARSQHDACEFTNPDDGLIIDGTCLFEGAGGSSGLACLPEEATEGDFTPEIEES